jgi:hypothetical protein
VITSTYLFIWLKKKDANPDYAITNNLHVMWSGGIIDTRDSHDLINVVFQSRHLNKIIVGSKMFGLFKKLHKKYRDNYITSAIHAIGSFLIHEERL